MSTYREVFTATAPPADPGRVFYTIRQADVGARFITTTVGVIELRSFMGKVLPCDVGKRIYRLPTEDETDWFWAIESDQQRTERVGEQCARAAAGH